MPFDWGHPKNPSVADAAAFALQTYDANTSIQIKQGRILFKVGSTTLEIVNEGMTLTTPSGTQTWGTG